MKKETTIRDIKSLTLVELSEQFRDQNLPAFRAKQVYQWLYRGAVSFEEMSDLPKNLRVTLAEKYYISVANIEKKLVSDYDNTVKYLFSFPVLNPLSCTIITAFRSVFLRRLAAKWAVPSVPPGKAGSPVI